MHCLVLHMPRLSLDATSVQASVTQWIADYRERSSAEAAPVPAGGAPPSEEDIAANKAAVDVWIAAWRAKVPEPVQAAAAAAPSAADVAQQQAEVQAWIDTWRAQPVPTNGAASTNGASQAAEVEAWIAQWRAKSGASQTDEVQAWIATWRSKSGAA